VVISPKEKKSAVSSIDALIRYQNALCIASNCGPTSGYHSLPFIIADFLSYTPSILNYKSL